jgi:PAS domain S-box-containing protein
LRPPTPPCNHPGTETRGDATTSTDPHGLPPPAGSSLAGPHEPPWAALLETLPAAFYVDRTDGTSVWVSPQIEAVVGCTQAEWADGYDAWARRIHPDDRDRVVASAQRFARSGSPASEEYRVVLPGGRERWIHDRALLLHGDADGEPLIYGIIVDVTDERTSHAIADRAGRLFRALVENADEAVTIVDEHGAVVYQNPTMGRVVGRPPDWFGGRSPLELMPDDDATRARELLAELAPRPGAQAPGEFRLRHRDGSWRVVSGVATNLLHDPAVRGIVLNYRDVTDERRAADRLRDDEQRRRELLETMVHAEDEERSRIAGELHDDTIQVITAALLELDRGTRHLDRGDVIAAREAVASAREALVEAAERTRRLTFELRPQLLEAAGLPAAVRDLADSLARDTGAEVEVTARIGRFPVDLETLVYRTVREAVVNVRRHARARHVAIRIGRSKGTLYGRIEDDGRGFRPARRNPPPSERLGLETARERVRAAGGALEVTSTPGSGTRFAFRIPLPADDPGRAAAER